MLRKLLQKLTLDLKSEVNLKLIDFKNEIHRLVFEQTRNQGNKIYKLAIKFEGYAKLWCMISGHSIL